MNDPLFCSHLQCPTHSIRLNQTEEEKMTGVIAENRTNLDEAKEEAEMRELLAKWEFENPEASDEDDGSVEEECMGYDDELEKYRREVHPKDNALDHVVLGTSDLDQSVDDFEKMTGVRPVSKFGFRDRCQAYDLVRRNLSLILLFHPFLSGCLS